MDSSDYVFYNISEGLKAMDELRFAIDDPGARIDFRYIPFWAKSLEKYRWPTTMALQCKFFFSVTVAWANNWAIFYETSLRS